MVVAYRDVASLRRVIQATESNITAETFEADVRLTLEVPDDAFDRFSEELKNATNGAAFLEEPSG